MFRILRRKLNLKSHAGRKFSTETQPPENKQKLIHRWRKSMEDAAERSYENYHSLNDTIIPGAALIGAIGAGIFIASCYA
jgi:hypothetical protein